VVGRSKILTTLPAGNKHITMRSLRRTAEILQAIVIIGLPFVKVNGESALRFDIPSLRLHVLGSAIWMQEFFIVLIAAIFLTLLIIFVTVVFGRVWCGWLCPQTVLIDFTPYMDKAKTKGLAYKGAALILTFLTSALAAASLIWYFVSPYEFLPDLFSGKLGSTAWGFWIVLSGILFLDYAFLRHKWCATVCPYARMQSVLFDKSTLIIELDPERAKECIDCRSCEKVCPTGLDIRKGLDAACINCAECVDACEKVMARSGKKGLIHYAFGAGGGGKILRQNVYVTGGFLLLFFVFILHLSAVRVGVDVTVLPHAMEPSLTRDEKVINAYVLSVKNMLDKPIDLKVTVERFDKSLIQSITTPLHLDAGAMDRFPLFVRTEKIPGAKGTLRIKVYLDNETEKIHITKEANFTIPDEL
jgi:cytochrome c oxidase accessory protein FixG